MAAFARTDPAQENTISINDDRMPGNPEARYECPICLNWLRDPALTSCGHRFCGKCITSWLLREGTCPVDQQPLKCEKDVFPDNFTRREISQILTSCAYAELGCTTILSPLELEGHEIHCSYKNSADIQNNSVLFTCTFSAVGCAYKCDNKFEIDKHLKNELQDHLNLVMLAYSKLNECNVINAPVSNLWDAPEKSKGQSSDTSEVHSESAAPNLMHALYERIVILEQKVQEQDLKLKSLTDKISNMSSDKTILGIHNLLETKYCNGVHIWKINDFRSKLDEMKQNPSILHYSKGILTSPYGYGFCARINVSPKEPNWLALHVHMMQTDHDSSLNWPFSGRINITLVHPSDTSKSQRDTIMSRSEILAFQRPICDISPRGFGFLDYTSLLAIEQFLENDILTIKIHIQTV